MKNSIEQALRIVAALMLLVVVIEYYLLDILMIPPLVVATILIGLSFVAVRLPRVAAAISIIISILVPVGAVIGYLSGQLVALIPIFDFLVFGWLLWVAILTLRKPNPVDSGNAPDP